MLRSIHPWINFNLVILVLINETYEYKNLKLCLLRKGFIDVSLQLLDR